MTVKNCQPILDDRDVRHAFSRLQKAVSVGEPTQMKQWWKIDGFFDDRNELAVAFDTTKKVHRVIIEDRRRGSRSSFQTNSPRPGSRHGEGLFVEDVAGKRYLTHSGVFILGKRHPTFGQGNREIRRAFLERCAKVHSGNDRSISVNGDRRYLIAPVDEKADVVFKHMRRALDDVTAFKNNDGEPPVAANEAAVDANLSPETERRYWLIRLGRRARFWQECHRNGIACIGWDHIGDLRKYATREEIAAQDLGKHASLACWQFCREMQPGDVVFVGFSRQFALGHGIVKSDYRFDDSRTEYRNVRDVEWHSDHHPGGVKVRDRSLVLKTLTDITKYPDQVDMFKAAVERPRGACEPRIPSYSIDTILDDGCFLERSDLARLLSRLQTKKNLILQGPPGTGKTWLAKRLAYALIGQIASNRMSVVQFHPSTSYEDFVCGWRPSAQGLRLSDGVFLRAVQAAIDDPLSRFVVVIEEINRGNPAQIFGELITLLEADKRKEAEAVELAYTEDGNPRRIYVPENLYVIGTMNIADRSLALVDYALRRRFAFATLAPNLGSRWRSWMTSELGIDDGQVGELERRIATLNDSIANDKSLGEQFRIGHSYVTPTHDIEPHDVIDWFTDVVDTEIVPLLEEYWFEDAERVLRERAKLVEDW